MTVGNRIRDLRGIATRRDPTALLWQAADSVSWRAQRRLNRHGVYEFVDRSTGADEMLIIVAGYRAYLWPYTLSRIGRFVPAGVDVCIVSPGVAPPRLDALAARNGWSWLHTRKNALALGQNLAIELHPRARYVHKLDEDIFVGEGYFTRMRGGLLRVRADGVFTPGFVAPVINVNGFSYRLFLEARDLVNSYQKRFGELHQACGGVRAQYDPEAAVWLWDHSLPLDETMRAFAERPPGYTPIPHRFSIGAFVLERDLWEAIGGFIVHARGGLGHEERQLCQECVDLSRVPVVLHDVFAGHFAFGSQEPMMRERLREIAGGLSVAAPDIPRDLVLRAPRDASRGRVSAP